MPTEAKQIDVANKWAVGAQSDSIVIQLPPRHLSNDDALALAAWLVAMAEPFASHKFSDVLAAVRNT